MTGKAAAAKHTEHPPAGIASVKTRGGVAFMVQGTGEVFDDLADASLAQAQEKNAGLETSNSELKHAAANVTKGMTQDESATTADTCHTTGPASVAAVEEPTRAAPERERGMLLGGD